MKKEYLILHDANPDTLADQVTTYLNDGYELHGDLQITPVGQHISFLQPMVKGIAQKGKYQL